MSTHQCNCCWHKHKAIVTFFQTEDTTTTKEYTTSELTSMVLSLIKEVTTLREKVDKIERKTNKKTKKYILEWLNSQYLPVIDFSSWLNILLRNNSQGGLVKEEFEWLNNFTFKECMMKLIKMRLIATTTTTTTSQNIPLPLCAFEEVNKNPYCFVRNKDSGEKKWQMMGTDEIKSIIHKIEHLYNEYYFEWSKQLDLNLDNELRIFYSSKIDCYPLLEDTNFIRKMKQQIYCHLPRFEDSFTMR